MQEHKFKTVLLGEGRVGKTSILLRYINNSFSEKQTSTFQASYQEKILNIGNNSVSLAIWDTAGQVIYSYILSLKYQHLYHYKTGEIPCIGSHLLSRFKCSDISV